MLVKIIEYDQGKGKGKYRTVGKVRCVRDFSYRDLNKEQMINAGSYATLKNHKLSPANLNLWQKIKLVLNKEVW